MLDIPAWTDVPDYFVWEAFHKASADRTRRLKKDSRQQDALLAETTAFYVIPDQFGVIDGHVLVLPKKQASSIASLEPDHDSEIGWLLAQLSAVMSRTYGTPTLIGEHGECGCVTAGQAHVHVIPLPPTLERLEFVFIVDEVLQRRMVGVECVIYRDTKFANLEDLHALLDAPGAETVGQRVTTSELSGAVNYPADARTASDLVQPYVYLSGPGVEFISTHHFRSQFVREVVGRAVGLPGRTWDRWVNTSRANMFTTFEQLAPALNELIETEHGFRARAGLW